MGVIISLGAISTNRVLEEPVNFKIIFDCFVVQERLRDCEKVKGFSCLEGFYKRNFLFVSC